jgi:hypothetical protein
VLGYVQYQKHQLVQRMRQANEEALRRGLLTFEESALLMRRYDEGLSGYTYLEEEEPSLRIENGVSGLTTAPPAPLPVPGLPTDPALVSAAPLPAVEPGPAAEITPRRRRRALVEEPPEQSSFLPSKES